MLSSSSSSIRSLLVRVRTCSHCEPGTLDESKIKGKIVLCHHSDDGDASKMDKADVLKSAGAAGAILVVSAEVVVATAYIDFPVTEVASAAADAIHKYMASTRYLITIELKRKPSSSVLIISIIAREKPTCGDHHADDHRDGVQASACRGLLLVQGAVGADREPPQGMK
jgi:hypothetical protein